MSKLLATAFTMLAASGCAASTPAAPIDDEPPPSSGPIRHVGSAVTSTSEKGWPTTSVSTWGGLWPPPTDAWPDGDPKSDPFSMGGLGPAGLGPPNPLSTSDLVFNPPTGLTADGDPQERTPVSR
jgi:hypothetical protein